MTQAFSRLCLLACEIGREEGREGGRGGGHEAAAESWTATYSLGTWPQPARAPCVCLCVCWTRGRGGEGARGGRVFGRGCRTTPGHSTAADAGVALAASCGRRRRRPSRRRVPGTRGTPWLAVGALRVCLGPPPPPAGGRSAVAPSGVGLGRKSLALKRFLCRSVFTRTMYIPREKRFLVAFPVSVCVRAKPRLSRQFKGWEGAREGTGAALALGTH